MFFAGGRIDALVACGADILGTSRPDRTRCGIGQVRRLVEVPALRLLHVVFAPDRARPLLLGLVRVESRSAELASLHYTETWDVTGTGTRAAEGACLTDTPQGTRALAEAGLAVRARAPQPLPRAGLALELRVLLPPGARRTLAFAYAAPEPGEDPAPLVRAWRGAVETELIDSAQRWRARLGPGANSVTAYRVEASR